jgi:hypothetical protein
VTDQDAPLPVVYQASDVSVMPAQRSPLYHLPLEKLEGFAQRAARSSLFGGVNTPEKALMRLAAGQARGLDPVASLSLVYILGGVPRLHASAIAGLIKASGRYRFRPTERTDTRCEIAWQERIDGAWVEVGTSAFSMEDAQRARLVRPDSGWVTWPRRMLFARALTEGAGVYCPEIVIGLGAIENYDGADTNTPDATAQAAVAAQAAIGGGLEPDTSPPPPETAPSTPPVESPSGERGQSPATVPAAASQDAPEPPPAEAPAAESLYDAIDAQRVAMDPDQLAAFVAWAQRQGIERPTVAAVEAQFGEKARDLAALMASTPLGPPPAEVAAPAEDPPPPPTVQTPEQQAAAQSFADEYARPPDVQTEMLDHRMLAMREAWDLLTFPDRGDLQTLLVDAGVVATVADAGPDVIALMKPDVPTTLAGLLALRDSLDPLAGSGPDQQTLT